MNKEVKVITPIPGTFYRKPSPDKEVFVNEGDTVEIGDTIGIVEVMKSFHEIKTEAAGKVGKIIIEDEDMVEAGQEIVTIIEN